MRAGPPKLQLLSLAAEIALRANRCTTDPSMSGAPSLAAGKRRGGLQQCVICYLQDPIIVSSSKCKASKVICWSAVTDCWLETLCKCFIAFGIDDQ